jgi:hypothetical protein
VDGISQGVGNAVVFLRSVDLPHSKPWDHPGVFVELSAKQMRVEQGHETVRTAIARRGERLSMQSKDDSFYVVRSAGTAFFGLTFVEPHKPRQRRLTKKGLIELSSAAGHFWQRGYVFVDDHPYYTRTDARGRFTLDHVPQGDYQIVCWMPNWRVKRQERDTESSLIRFVTLGPPLERVQTVVVRPGSEPSIQFLVDEKLFHP